MPIFGRFFKSRSVLPTKCPMCGKVGEFRLDSEPSGALALDSKTHVHVHECRYCTSGMLLCIRDGRLMGVEPFTDDPPMDGLAALARTRAKLGL